MNWLQFISSVISSVAWPITAVIAVAVLRQPLASLLRGPMRRLKVGPVEAEWDPVAREVRRELEVGGESVPLERTGGVASKVTLPPLPEELGRLATVSPETAVLEGYRRVEQELRAILAVAGYGVDEPATASGLARIAEERGYITRETRDAVDGLSVLRNMAAHGQLDVDTARALEFTALSDGVLYSLRRASRGSDEEVAARPILVLMSKSGGSPPGVALRNVGLGPALGTRVFWEKAGEVFWNKGPGLAGAAGEWLPEQTNLVGPACFWLDGRRGVGSWPSPVVERGGLYAYCLDERANHLRFDLGTGDPPEVWRKGADPPLWAAAFDHNRYE